jgi:hypothetical protein
MIDEPSAEMCNGRDDDCDGRSDEAGCGAQSICIAATCVPTRRVFVTSASIPSTLGSHTNYDARCQSIASAAGLGGTWMAWLSTTGIGGSSPSVRFTRATVPYRLLNGTSIANSYADLSDGSIAAAINLTETFTTLTNNYAWSATTETGTAMVDNCGNWTTTTGNARTGFVHAASGWSSAALQLCSNTTYRIYCFEQ